MLAMVLEDRLGVEDAASSLYILRRKIEELVTSRCEQIFVCSDKESL